MKEYTLTKSRIKLVNSLEKTIVEYSLGLKEKHTPIIGKTAYSGVFLLISPLIYMSYYLEKN